MTLQDYREQRFDIFAAAALQALIAKLPMLDTDGEKGKPISEDELSETMKQISRSAYGYA